MANNFSRDPNCVALYTFENAANLGEDSVGGNDLANQNVTRNTTEHREGAASASFAGASDTRLTRADADLDAGFPFRVGDATKRISLCFWMRPSSLPSYAPAAGVGYIIGKYLRTAEVTGNARSWIALLRTAAGATRIGWMGGSKEGDISFGWWGTDDVGGNHFATTAELVGLTVDAANHREGTACLSFDGTDDYCVLADSALDAGFPLKSGDTKRKISVCFWCNPNQLPSVNNDFDYLVAKHNSPANKRSFAVALTNIGGVVKFSLLLGYNGGASFQQIDHPGTPETGKWYFVSASYDDADKSYRLRIWDDVAAALLGGAEAAGTATNNINVEDVPWTVGSRGDLAYFYGGLVDYLSVFNDVLTSGEMDKIRTGAKDPAADDNCAALWRFDLGYVDKNTTIQVDRWYHVGITYDDNTGAWRVRVWDDTAKTATESTGTASHKINIEDAGFCVGDQIGTTNPFAAFKGLLDEVVVHNDILTSGEIDQIRMGTFVPTPPYLLPFPATLPCRERLDWNTAILPGGDRSEQWLAHRAGVPVQSFVYQLFCRTEAQGMELMNILHAGLKQQQWAPVWPEAERHAGPLAAGATALVFDARYADYRTGGSAVLYTSPELMEVVTTATVADGGLTLAAPGLAHDYPGGAWIMPCRLGYVVAAVPRERFAGGGSVVEVTYRVADNIALSGYTAALTYDGYEVLTDPAVLTGGAFRETHQADCIQIDAGIGAFKLVAPGTFNVTTQDHGWLNDTKAKAWAFRLWLHSVVGRRQAFLVPTFRPDFVLSRACGADDTSLYVTNYGFYRNMRGVNALRTYLAFRPAGSQILPRKIKAIVAASSAEERIDLDAAPGQAFKAGDTLCWVDRCRLASDTIELDWYRRGRCTSETQLVRVPQ